MEEYKKFKEKFDKNFSRMIKDKIENSISYSKYLPANESIKYLEKITGDGKRLRPYLAHLAYKNKTKKNEKNIDSLLFAIELLHIFCLIHDDVMDKSEKRHGVLTSNNFFGTKYKDAHFGNSIAILLGDLVFLWSQECIQDIESEHKVEIVNLFHQMISTVMYGQTLDIYLTKDKDIRKDLVTKKMNLKSSSYTFYYPILLGFQMAGHNETSNKVLKKFAENLGSSFQLKDDLLDLDIKSQKTPFLDLETGQHTILSWYLCNEADDKYKKLFKKYFGKGKIKPRDYNHILEIFQTSGAVKYCDHLMEKYNKETEKNLYSLGLNKTSGWIEILEMLKIRKK